MGVLGVNIAVILVVIKKMQVQVGGNKVEVLGVNRVGILGVIKKMVVWVVVNRMEVLGGEKEMQVQVGENKKDLGTKKREVPAEESRRKVLVGESKMEARVGANTVKVRENKKGLGVRQEILGGGGEVSEEVGISLAEEEGLLIRINLRVGTSEVERIVVMGIMEVEKVGGLKKGEASVDDGGSAWKKGWESNDYRKSSDGGQQSGLAVIYLLGPLFFVLVSRAPH